MKIPKFITRGAASPRETVAGSLGSLESATMAEVWRRKEVSVRQVETAFGERVAYTTVMTTLDRLYKKGLLERRKTGRAFLYSPRFSPEELELHITGSIVGQLLDTAAGQIEPVLSCIVDAVGERDLLLLDELERIVREKRRELEGKE